MCIRDRVYNLKFDLAGDPKLTKDGGIVAGIADLNPLDGGVPQDVRWMQNEAFDLGCGTFYVPPPVNDVLDDTEVVGPQHEWLRSAEAADLPGLLADPVRGARDLRRPQLQPEPGLHGGPARADRELLRRRRRLRTGRTVPGRPLVAFLPRLPGERLAPAVEDRVPEQLPERRDPPRAVG